MKLHLCAIQYISNPLDVFRRFLNLLSPERVPMQPAMLILTQTELNELPPCIRQFADTQPLRPLILHHATTWPCLMCLQRSK